MPQYTFLTGVTPGPGLPDDEPASSKAELKPLETVSPQATSDTTQVSLQDAVQATAKEP